MTSSFPGLAYNTRQTITGRTKRDGFASASFDLIGEVLWFNQKRSGVHPALSFAIGNASEVSVEMQRQLAFVVVSATGPGGSAALKMNTTVSTMFLTVFDNLARNRKAVANGSPAASPPRSMADQIRELGRLRDEGLITEEEFRQGKARLLGRPGS